MFEIFKETEACSVSFCFISVASMACFIHHRKRYRIFLRMEK